MLQIKNTLGGGKPEGLYAWKKSSVACIDNITTQTGKNYTLGNATSDTTVYYSTSYTFDEATGIYTLVNPQSANLAYNGSGGAATVSMEKSKYYIWGSTSSDKIYTTNDGSTYNVGIRNVGGSVFLESTATNEKYDIHSAKAEYTFLDYIVSDKETAYPDGGEKNGYWYEKVSDGFTSGELTLASSVSTITIEHGLGKIPTWFVLASESKPTAQSVPIQMYFAPWVGATVRYYASGDSFNFYQNQSTYITAIDENSITLKGWTSFTQSIPLHWIAI